MTINYRASDQSYTISDGTRTRTFLPANIDPAQSNASITTYRITSGNTTEFLTLTKPGTGAGQTRYVAAGFWQRQVNGATVVDGSFHAFTYGVPTPNGAVPRNGSAAFDVKLLGASTLGTTIYSMSGSGQYLVDFLSGGMAGRGTYERRDATTGMLFGSASPWTSRALLSSSDNSFAGTINLDSLGVGSLRGLLFGPAADEFGASFASRPDPALFPGNDSIAVGTLTGARGTASINSGTYAINNRSTEWFFKPLTAGIQGNSDSVGTLLSLSQNAPLASVYLPINGGSFVFYRSDGQIYLPRESTGISSFPLSYSLFSPGGLQFQTGGLFLNQSSGAMQVDAFLFGADTLASALPRTGSGSYNATVRGAVGNAGSKFQSLNGSGSLNTNFATGAISTLGTYRITDEIGPGNWSGTGATVDNGSWTGTATLSSNANAYAGTIAFNGTKVYSGSLTGRFFGANADEFGAVFNAQATGGATVVGTLQGARGQDTTASQLGLAGLTTLTALGGNSFGYIPARLPQIGASDPTVQVDYDPVAKTYVFKSITTGQTLGIPPIDQTVTAAQRDAARSNATFDYYTGPNLDARIYKFGPGNPDLVLTYTSFAEITAPAAMPGQTAQTTTYYVPFGGLTPQFQIPTSGTAVYNGIVFGRGGGGVGSGNWPDSQLSGTSQFTVNFGTGASTMALDLFGTDKNNIRQGFGTFNFTGSISGQCPGCGITNRWAIFANSATNPTVGSWSGSMRGFFAGKDAAEIAASFGLAFKPPGELNEISYAGVTVGKKN
jgi:hypothetical protein